MREKVVLLKDHPDLFAQLQLVEFRVVDLDPLYFDGACLNVIQPVDAADQRGFARA